MTTPALRVLGTMDEITSCDCCGRRDLRSTVALADTESGDVVHYGVTCAARAMRQDVAQVRRQVSAADTANRRAREAEATAASVARVRAWDAFLARLAPAAPRADLPVYLLAAARAVGVPIEPGDVDPDTGRPTFPAYQRIARALRAIHDADPTRIH